eukprot:CAMPEP_0198254712 /NCGR_PEP_ID=MMETSP1447-20131203/4988_1 /TAXON_ID=420782 /ORGANISM="Chaetoceros dichaeta, Strain CCMP1751" /LENGTH=244 /DNA_ID=CAMNT_0043940879 /DNA_START=130 /DNA_END=861 /DNA_ORIENTATION=+
MPESNPPKPKVKPNTTTTTTTTTTKKKKNTLPPQPPLQAAAKRLERLLGRTSGSNTTIRPNNKTNNATNHTTANSLIEEANIAPHSNPCKIVKRWIGTSSIVASKAKPADISNAAKTLLDPMGMSATGRDLLLQLATLLPPTPEDDQTMEEFEVKTTEPTTEVPQHLSASAREVEAWLLSLAIRVLWNHSKEEEALQLATKAIAIVTTHLDEATTTTATANTNGGGTAKSTRVGFAASRSALYP